MLRIAHDHEGLHHGLGASLHPGEVDARLRELESQRSLTAVEQVEYGTLKKQKLLAKDRIVRLQAADRRS